MKPLKSLVRVFTVFLALAAAQLAHAQPPSYKLNPGDVLQIDVWNEESLTREVMILPDGYISFPLAGNLKLGGKTVADGAAELAEALGKYLKDEPSVTISVLKQQGYKIYVLGKVNRPGEFAIVRPTDVMQALAMAGGLNTFASEGGIRILRRNENGEQVALRFDYGEVKSGDKLETNVVLQSGDVVVVQ